MNVEEQRPPERPQKPQTPLGGTLVDRTLTGEAREAALERVGSLPALMVDREAEITFEMVATGVFSPLSGPLTKAENECVVETGRLLDGTPWPIPLSFAPAGRRNAQVLARLSEGDEVALLNRAGEPVALLEVEELFAYDREERARRLFGTTSADVHPGVKLIYERMGDISVAGKISLLERPGWGVFERHRRTPAETYDLLYGERGYRTVAGFITGANPPHVGHEYMHRTALELVDAVLLLPQVEMERPEYVKADYRIMALEALRDAYYPPFRVVMAALRTNYLFAGPREAVLHALIMRNYGCTHAMIGRDHAGVGDLYDLYAGHRIFEEYAPGELGIELMLFNEIFFCTRCGLPATEHTCPHDTRYRLQVSGTGIREVLRRGYFPPKEICRPEVSHIAIQGVVPSGLQQGEDGPGLYPAGQTVHSLFPFYEVSDRLGGYLRREPVWEEDLGERDLEAALLDARSHADEIYRSVYEEMATDAEANRSLSERWRVEAREILRDHQADLVGQLEDKLSLLRAGLDPLTGESDAEARADLERAKQVQDSHPRPLYPDESPRLRPSTPPGGAEDAGKGSGQ
ncbi:MAG: hypothetical protein Kow00129_04150 [Thermoleophilia bacterium]